MKLHLTSETYIRTEEGVDLSIPLEKGNKNVNAWYCEPVKIEPVVTANFIGDILLGGTVDFKTITVNPHGNGTHTECVGHIASEHYTINKCLTEFHFLAKIISVTPKLYQNPTYNEEDYIIDRAEIEKQTVNWKGEKALIVRTLPNPENKKLINYSGNNPPYFTGEAIETINELGVEHLMTDLPSVDRETDGGALVSHKTFWNYPENPVTEKTISELLYIPNHLEDGTYFVQVQIISLENDASPSKIIAHKIHTEK